MSLYTPVFPPFHESNISRKASVENVSAVTPGKQHNYIELLRDVHLFLSTKNDVLSPPSRPNSPLFDHRVQKVKDEVHDFFDAAGGRTSSGQWTRVSQTLKLGCVRGRHWSVPKADPCVPDEDTSWILPDEESEWFEWEKKREEDRRLRAKTNASQRIGSATSAAPDSLKPNHASVADLSQSCDKAREQRPQDVSPTTLRAAKEKVRKWQASVASDVCDGTTSGSSLSSMRATVAETVEKSHTERPQRSRTIDFAVVKPVANSTVGKRGKGSLLRSAIPGDSTPSPRLSRASTLPGDVVPADKTGSKRPLKTLHGKDVTPKIGDVPETPYLPPSFPAHLETSTPLPDPLKLVRAKPSPILPLPISSSAPLPTLADPPDDRQLVPAEPHAASAPSSLPPQINTVQTGKRSRALSSSLDGVPDDIRVPPSAKRLQILSQAYSSTVFKHSQPISPFGDLDLVPCTQDDARDLNFGAAPSHQHHEMTSPVPLTPGKNEQPATDAVVQGSSEKVPSPAKSVKSYFSTPDSDSVDSPMRANLLLESPVSPMLSYARNPSEFLPQFTSTQVGKGPATAGRTNNGIFGMGYSSQFDVERHVDRVSELLEKDVDFDGWLRDMRTVKTDED